MPILWALGDFVEAKSWSLSAQPSNPVGLASSICLLRKMGMLAFMLHNVYWKRPFLVTLLRLALWYLICEPCRNETNFKWMILEHTAFSSLRTFHWIPRLLSWGFYLHPSSSRCISLRTCRSLQNINSLLKVKRLSIYPLALSFPILSCCRLTLLTELPSSLDSFLIIFSFE